MLHARPYELDDLYITAVVTTTTVVAVVVYYAFRLAEQAQEETDTLLHNILPTPIVERLKGAPGAIIADELADASVLFADLKGFVSLAKRLGPARTVGLLNIVVSAFDDLADQWRRREDQDHRRCLHGGGRHARARGRPRRTPGRHGAGDAGDAGAHRARPGRRAGAAGSASPRARCWPA